ncbi:MAG: hypothetical protein E6K76_00290 [Candidatus Eisenbacteria bacterium]|uniref:Uncharacterized protein n=1 Tax=Eiseniibacteriota bacterium TaxID=2212470 RepID=A0A538TBE2_UNCEI|nr:MAG: hypothetical protein E6K76_00290 [Candidatus Eisenbacteria bacterium]
MHVRRWPATRRFDGVVYRLEYSASHYDVVKLNLPSMADIDSGWDYNAHYVTYSRDGKRSSGRGPSYYWRSDSTLSERAYAAPGGTREWLYDRVGRIYQYSFREYDSKGLSMWGEEWFAENGVLVGCRFGIRKRAGLVGKTYWMGSEQDSNELERLLARFFHWKYGGG